MIICGLKNPPSKFQPPIRSKCAWTKTRAEKYNGYDLRCVPFSTVFPIQADLLQIWSWSFGREILGPKMIHFSLGVWNPLTFAHPSGQNTISYLLLNGENPRSQDSVSVMVGFEFFGSWFGFGSLKETRFWVWVQFDSRLLVQAVIMITITIIAIK